MPKKRITDIPNSVFDLGRIAAEPRKTQADIVLEILGKGPATAAQVSQLCGIHLSAVSAVLAVLVAKKQVAKIDIVKSGTKRSRSVYLWSLVDAK